MGEGAVTKAVRVKHNGTVSELEVLVIDETEHGGKEVFRQLAEKLDLSDVKRLKVVHKGKIVTTADVCRVLRDDSRAIIQVFGSRDRLAPSPISFRAWHWWSRMRAAWESAQDSMAGRMAGQVVQSGFVARAQRFVLMFLHATWLFLLTFWPGYDGGRIEGLHREGDPRQGEEAGGEEVAMPQRRWRVDTDAQRCRDEINRETIQRNPPQ